MISSNHFSKILNKHKIQNDSIHIDFLFYLKPLQSNSHTSTRVQNSEIRKKKNCIKFSISLHACMYLYFSHTIFLVINYEDKCMF